MEDRQKQDRSVMEDVGKRISSIEGAISTQGVAMTGVSDQLRLLAGRRAGEIAPEAVSGARWEERGAADRVHVPVLTTQPQARAPAPLATWRASAPPPPKEDLAKPPGMEDVKVQSDTFAVEIKQVRFDTFTARTKNNLVALIRRP